MTITPVSVDSAGNQANGYSSSPSISADGRFVAFYSLASNLVPGDTNGTRDIFVRDRLTNTTTRVSVDSAGNQENGTSFFYAPSISADGRFVAFSSNAFYLVPGDTNSSRDIFVRDTLTNTTTNVSVDSAGNPGGDVFPPSQPTGGLWRFIQIPPTSCRGILTIQTTFLLLTPAALQTPSTALQATTT